MEVVGETEVAADGGMRLETDAAAAAVNLTYAVGVD